MNLQEFLNNIMNTVGSYLPGVIGALVVLIIGWFLAGVFRRLTRRLLKKTEIDNRLVKKGLSKVSAENFISKLVYYLVLMIVLLVVLEMLGVHNVLDPIKNMVNEFITFIPNIIAAGIIGFAGYIIATVVSEILGFAGDKLDTYSTKMGISNDVDLGGIIKKIVFAIVFIPLLIAALDALQLNVISDPFKEMLTTFINAIPNILAAGLIIAIFYFGGRFLVGIITDLLKGLGMDEMAAKLNLTGIIGENQSFSKLLANIGFFFLMFTGIIIGVEKLNFGQVTVVLTNLLELSGQIFFGLLIMVLGNWIANIVHDALSKSDSNTFIASIGRIAVLGLFLAIALRTMGIANEIVNLAFGLTLGSIAVAIALSFGLGGREAAGKQMEHILENFRKKD
ncbi:MAG: mechanosensitive ion channel [Bacteroidia bacterium]|nr:mechanosensitive ion channel [Bacteroidia bacterium]